MQNLLLRENTTQLSDVNLDLRSCAGFTLESGLTSALVELTEQDVHFYESLVKANAILEDYKEAKVDKETQKKTKNGILIKIKESISKLIHWFFEKISAFNKLLREVCNKISKTISDTLSKTKFNLNGSDTKIMITWFPDDKYKTLFNDFKIQNAIDLFLNLATGEWREAQFRYVKAADGAKMLSQDIGLREKIEKYKKEMDKLTKVNAAEYPEWRSNNSAKIVVENIQRSLDKLNTYLDHSINLNKRFEDQLMRALEKTLDKDVGEPLSESDYPDAQKLISMYIKEILSCCNELKDIYIKLLTICKKNANIIISRLNEIQKEHDSSKSKEENTFLVSDEFYIQSLCESEISVLLSKSHIDSNGKVVIY